MGTDSGSARMTLSRREEESDDDDDDNDDVEEVCVAVVMAAVIAATGVRMLSRAVGEPVLALLPI